MIRAVFEVQTLAHMVGVDLVALKQVSVAHRLPVAKGEGRVLNNWDERTPDAEKTGMSAEMKIGSKGNTLRPGKEIKEQT